METRRVKHTVRRAAGISWEQWHRMVVMQSLKMMVMSGVVRRADLDPPLAHLGSAEAGTEEPGGSQGSAIGMTEPSWFARMFLSREYLLRRHH
jgi:hypothetical protein